MTIRIAPLIIAIICAGIGIWLSIDAQSFWSFNNALAFISFVFFFKELRAAFPY